MLLTETRDSICYVILTYGIDVVGENSNLSVRSYERIAVVSYTLAMCEKSAKDLAFTFSQSVTQRTTSVP